MSRQLASRVEVRHRAEQPFPLAPLEVPLAHDRQQIGWILPHHRQRKLQVSPEQVPRHRQARRFKDTAAERDAERFPSLIDVRIVLPGRTYPVPLRMLLLGSLVSLLNR